MCHVTISMLSGNTAYCVKLSGEDLSRYSNKIESVGLSNYVTDSLTLCIKAPLSGVEIKNFNYISRES